MCKFSVAVAILLAFAIAAPCSGAVSPLMNFQGVARDAGGAIIANGTYEFHFRIYDDSTDGNLAWEEEQNVAVTNGLFSVLLGAANLLVDPVFQTAVWLEVEFSGTILPRVPITTSGYSYRVSTIDGSTGGIVTGSVETGSGHDCIGTDHFVAGNTHVLSGEYSSIGGGRGDTVTADFASIGGGENNAATGLYAFIGGGQENHAPGEASSVIGGKYNIAGSHQSFVGGGRDNEAGSHAAVCGGLGNAASGEQSFIGGGHDNSAPAIGATVSGGFWNDARGEYSAVCGGGGMEDFRANIASGTGSFIGGGQTNKARGTRSVVCGGGGPAADSNLAYGASSFVGGGAHNVARGELSVVCGGGTAMTGDTNVAAGTASFIGAGSSNYASGNYSAIPGGLKNAATGLQSFAAGSRARARHGYSFVWGDGDVEADSVVTDASHQFKIRAENGTRFASEAGNTKEIGMGDHYRDNGIIAWAHVSASGSMGTTEFGVADCYLSGMAGQYYITLDASAASAAQLVATATAEVASMPVSAASLRIISIQQASANSFYVYINNGTGLPVDNDFVFIVTGR